MRLSKCQQNCTTKIDKISSVPNPTKTGIFQIYGGERVLGTYVGISSIFRSGGAFWWWYQIESIKEGFSVRFNFNQNFLIIIQLILQHLNSSTIIKW